MEDNTLKVMCAIICITLLDGIALVMGVDGVVMSTTIAIIAGLAGFITGVKKEEIKAYLSESLKQ